MPMLVANTLNPSKHRYSAPVEMGSEYKIPNDIRLHELMKLKRRTTLKSRYDDLFCQNF
jgi:hypothetical protein